MVEVISFAMRAVYYMNRSPCTEPFASIGVYFILQYCIADTTYRRRRRVCRRSYATSCTHTHTIVKQQQQQQQ